MAKATKKDGTADKRTKPGKALKGDYNPPNKATKK